ncbi:MAG: hypothetical protein H0X24_23730 [Ktedonobacterales bacterium]|nr:hypothetical protein [Ktedonobacterales bacterium]
MPTPVLTTAQNNQNVSAIIATPTLIKALAILDTGNHDPTTDTPGTNTFLADGRFHPSGRLLFVNNGLNQSVTVTLVASFDGVNIVTQGTGVAVTANTPAFWIDSTALAQLANAYPFVGVRVTAGVAPTTGTITVNLCAKSV